MPADFQTVETRCGREGQIRPRGHSENPRCSCQQTPRGLETRCGREGHTRPRGPSESPDGVDPNIRRTIKTQREGHNSGVKIWSLCSVSGTFSHANLKQPFRTLAIKWEVNMLKKPSCVFLHASLLLCRCDAANDYITLLCRKVRPPNECPEYDTKQSDGEVPVMLGLWGMQNTPSLPLFPGTLWPGVVAPDRALSMG